MDRNQFTGLILMFALLAVYFTWFAPEPAVEELANILEEKGIKIAQQAAEYSKHANRKTITDADIKLAMKSK